MLMKKEAGLRVIAQKFLKNILQILILNSHKPILRTVYRFHLQVTSNYVIANQKGALYIISENTGQINMDTKVLQCLRL